MIVIIIIITIITKIKIFIIVIIIIIMITKIITFIIVIIMIIIMYHYVLCIIIMYYFYCTLFINNALFNNKDFTNFNKYTEHSRKIGYSSEIHGDYNDRTSGKPFHYLRT